MILSSLLFGVYLVFIWAQIGKVQQHSTKHRISQSVAVQRITNVGKTGQNIGVDIRNQQVAGSSPASSSKKPAFSNIFCGIFRKCGLFSMLFYRFSSFKSVNLVISSAARNQKKRFFSFMFKKPIAPAHLRGRYQIICKKLFN